MRFVDNLIESNTGPGQTETKRYFVRLSFVGWRKKWIEKDRIFVFSVN